MERMLAEGFDARTWATPDKDARAAMDAAREQAGIQKKKSAGGYPRRIKGAKR